MKIEKNLLYTKEHEWVKDLGGGTMLIGITDHAQEAMGDVSYVELPEIGASFSAGDAFCTVESYKAASEVYAPFDMKIVEVNDSLEDTPEAINEGPYDAWIVKAKAEKTDSLLSADDYEALLKSE